MLGAQPTLTEAKQLYHLQLNAGRCDLAAPAAELSAVIDYYWLLTISGPHLLLDIIPDTAVDLVVSPDIPDFAALYLPVTQRYCLELAGPVHYAGICFRASQTPSIFNAELTTLSALSAGSQTIEALGLQDFLQQLHGLHTLDRLTPLFDQFWLNRLEGRCTARPPEHRFKHDELIAILEQSVGENSIASICQSLDISERQFRRLSNDLFGFSPKKLQNVLRLQAALDELFRCEAQQVRDLYYDDSHRIRELKRLTGFTPGEIRQMAEKYNSR